MDAPAPGDSQEDDLSVASEAGSWGLVGTPRAQQPGQVQQAPAAVSAVGIRASVVSEVRSQAAEWGWWVSALHVLMLGVLSGDGEDKEALVEAIEALTPLGAAQKLQAFIVSRHPDIQPKSRLQAGQLLTWICREPELRSKTLLEQVVEFFGRPHRSRVQQEVARATLAQLLFCGDEGVMQLVVNQAGGTLECVMEQELKALENSSCLEVRQLHCDAVGHLLRLEQPPVVAPDTAAQLVQAASRIVLDAKHADEPPATKLLARQRAMELLATVLKLEPVALGQAPAAASEAPHASLCEEAILDMLDDTADGSAGLGLGALGAYLEAAAAEHPAVRRLACDTESIPLLAALLHGTGGAADAGAALALDALRVLQRLMAAGGQAALGKLVECRGLETLLGLAKCTASSDQHLLLLAQVCAAAAITWPCQPSPPPPPPPEPTSPTSAAATFGQQNLCHLSSLLLHLLAALNGEVVTSALQGLVHLLNDRQLEPMQLDSNFGGGGSDLGSSVGGGTAFGGRCCRPLKLVLERCDAAEKAAGMYRQAERMLVLQEAANLLVKLFACPRIRNTAAECGLLSAVQSSGLLMACPNLLRALLLLARGSPDLHARLSGPGLHAALQAWVVDALAADTLFDSTRSCKVVSPFRNFLRDGKDKSLVEADCAGDSSGDGSTAGQAAACASLQLLSTLLGGPAAQHMVCAAAQAYTKRKAGSAAVPWGPRGMRRDFVNCLLALEHLTSVPSSGGGASGAPTAPAPWVGHAACILESLLPDKRVFGLWWNEWNATAPNWLARAISNLCCDVLRPGPAGQTVAAEAGGGAHGQGDGAYGGWDRLLCLISAVRLLMARQRADRQRLRWLGSVVQVVVDVVLSCCEAGPDKSGEHRQLTEGGQWQQQQQKRVEEQAGRCVRQQRKAPSGEAQTPAVGAAAAAASALAPASDAAAASAASTSAASISAAGAAPPPAMQAVLSGCLAIVREASSAVPTSYSEPSAASKPADLLHAALLEHPCAAQLVEGLLQLSCVDVSIAEDETQVPRSLAELATLAAEACTALTALFDPLVVPKGGAPRPPPPAQQQLQSLREQLLSLRQQLQSSRKQQQLLWGQRLSLWGQCRATRQQQSLRQQQEQSLRQQRLRQQEQQLQQQEKQLQQQEKQLQQQEKQLQQQELQLQQEQEQQEQEQQQQQQQQQQHQQQQQQQQQEAGSFIGPDPLAALCALKHRGLALAHVRAILAREAGQAEAAAAGASCAPSDLRSRAALAMLRILLRMPSMAPLTSAATSAASAPSATGTAATSSSPATGQDTVTAAAAASAPTPSHNYFDVRLAGQLLRAGLRPALLALIKCPPATLGLAPREAAMKLLVSCAKHLRPFMLKMEDDVDLLHGLTAIFPVPKPPADSLLTTWGPDSREAQLLQVLGCRLLQHLIHNHDTGQPELNQAAKAALYRYGLITALYALCPVGASPASEHWWHVSSTSDVDSLSQHFRSGPCDGLLAAMAELTLQECLGFAPWKEGDDHRQRREVQQPRAGFAALAGGPLEP